MKQEDAIKIFEQKQIRSIWNEEEEKWYFSVIDVIEVLTDSPRPRKYWNALKTKLKNEASELSQKLGQLKLNKLRIYEDNYRCNKRRVRSISNNGLHSPICNRQ